MSDFGVMLFPSPAFVTIGFGINDSAVDVLDGKTQPRVSIRDYEEEPSRGLFKDYGGSEYKRF